MSDDNADPSELNSWSWASPTALPMPPKVDGSSITPWNWFAAPTELLATVPRSVIADCIKPVDTLNPPAESLEPRRPSRASSLTSTHCMQPPDQAVSAGLPASRLDALAFGHGFR